MKARVKKEIWMPHAAHFICGRDFRFHLATHVNGFVVSTVGEYLPSEGAREILAKSRNIVLEGRGDDREVDWLKKNGWEEIGLNRTYETMVFRAKKSGEACCPFVIISGEMDFEGYKDAGNATRGHYLLVMKWAKNRNGKRHN